MHSTSKTSFLALTVLLFMGTLCMVASPVEISSAGDIEWASDNKSLRITGDVEIVQDPFRLLSDSILIQEDFNRIQAIGEVRLYYNTESEEAEFELPEFQPLMASENLPAERKLLEAEQLIFNTETQLVEPVGAAQINLGLIRVLGRDLKLNFQENAFESQQYRVGMATLYLEGDSLNYTDQVLIANNARFFFGEPEALSIQGSARKITKTEDNKLRMEGITLRAGPVPFFYWPRYTHNLERSEFSISGSAGYSGDFGAYIRLRPKYSPNNKFSLHTDTHYYIERGFLVGPGFTLDFEDLNNHTLRTNLETGYINDSGLLGSDIFNRPIEPERYYTDLDLVYRYGNNLQVLSQVQSWSDSEIVRDFDGGRFRQIQQPENFAEINYQYGPLVASVFTRFEIEDFELAREKLPELTLEMLPSQFIHPDLYHSFKLQATEFEEDDFVSFFGELRPSLDSYRRYQGNYEIKFVQNITDWLDFIPIATLNTIQYEDIKIRREDTRLGFGSFSSFISNDNRPFRNFFGYSSIIGQPDFQNTRFQLGFDLIAHTHAQWDLDNSVWDISGLRHILQPVLQYRSLIQNGDNELLVNPIERSIFRTGLPDIFDLFNLRSPDNNFRELHMVRLGIRNSVFAKQKSDQSIRQLLQFDLYHDSFLDTEGTTQASLFTTELNLEPAPWINLNLQTRIDTEEFGLSDSFANLEITNGDIWRAQIGSQFISRALQQYLFYFDYKLSESVKFLSVLGYDADEGNLYEQSYGIQFGVGNYWDILIGVRDRSGSRRNNDLRLEFKVVTAQF